MQRAQSLVSEWVLGSQLHPRIADALTVYWQFQYAVPHQVRPHGQAAHEQEEKQTLIKVSLLLVQSQSCPHVDVLCHCQVPNLEVKEWKWTMSREGNELNKR